MSTSEEFRLNGEEILQKIKDIVHEGNVRRVIIKDKEGRVVMEFPLTLGLVGTLLAPTLAAIGAAAAILTEATLIVERDEETEA